MVPDRQKVRTDGRTDGRTHRRRQNYIPPTSSGDNKRALGPWVTHLRITVYKGLGEHSSSQSPTMNFYRSAVLLSVNVGYADKINRM